MALLAMTLGIGGYRLSNGLHILRARSLLSGRRMELMKFSRALEDFDDKSVCIGYGFTWLPEHTQKLHDLSRLNISTLMLPSFMHRLFNRHDKTQLPEEIGMPYLTGWMRPRRLCAEPSKTLRAACSSSERPKPVKA